MAIAKGSKSSLFCSEEATFNVVPTAQYEGIPFKTESLNETINKIISDEIRSDRQVPSIRGGNIQTGGNITTDFSPGRHIVWLRHLLAGTIVKHTVGKSTLTPDVVIAALATGAITRGTYVLSNSNVYLCVQGGTIATIGTGLVSSSGVETLPDGSGTQFEFLRSDAAVFYQYTITPGIDFPSYGLSLEKRVLGGNSDLYVLFEGSRINTLALTMAQEQIVSADWGLLGMRSIASGASVSTGDQTFADDPFIGTEAFFQQTDAATLANPSQVNRPIQQGTLNFTNNCETNVFAWGSRFRRDIPGNRREISGQITTYFEDLTEYNDFKNETTFGALISLNRQGKFCLFQFPECKLTGSGTPTIGGQGVITSQFNFDVFHQAGSFDAKVIIYTTNSTRDTMGGT